MTLCSRRRRLARSRSGRAEGDWLGCKEHGPAHRVWLASTDQRSHGTLAQCCGPWSPRPRLARSHERRPDLNDNELSLSSAGLSQTRLLNGPTSTIDNELSLSSGPLSFWRMTARAQHEETGAQRWAVEHLAETGADQMTTHRCAGTKGSRSGVVWTETGTDARWILDLDADRRSGCGEWIGMQMWILSSSERTLVAHGVIAATSSSGSGMTSR